MLPGSRHRCGAGGAAFQPWGDVVKTVGLALLVGTAVTVAACESIGRGTWQDLTIKTEPAGAFVLLSDGQKCTSPCQLRVARYRELTADISLKGCRTWSEHLSPTVASSDFSIVYRSVYDYQLGGVYDVEPVSLTVPLVCGAAADYPSPKLTAHDLALLSQFDRLFIDTERPGPPPPP